MIEYRIIRSRRGSIAIEVNAELEVIVRAPYLAPKSAIEKFVLSKEEWIKKAMEKMKGKAKNSPKLLSDEKVAALREKAKAEIPKRVEYYSEITGLKPAAIKITSAKTRFGSCSGKNSLCFSLFLMRYPSECIDYVVLHELCHIKHKNHGKQFYALLEKYMPDYKIREKMLKNTEFNTEK